MLAEKLNMNVDDAESWIVNLIRSADMDAKIDSKKVNFIAKFDPIFNSFFYSENRNLIKFTRNCSIFISQNTICDLSRSTRWHCIKLAYPRIRQISSK